MINKQILIASCLWLGEIMIGILLGWTSPILPKLQDSSQTTLDHPITEEEASWISSVVYIGTILSPSLLGNLPNSIGRKRSLQIASAITLVAFIIMTFARNFPMLIVFRLLSGFGMAMIKLCDIIYISEISSTKNRGTLLSCSDIFSALGSLLVYSTAPFIPYAYTGYLSLAILTTHFVGLFYIPESPSYYLIKDQIEQAQQTLIYLGRDDDINTLKYSPKEDSIENEQKEYSIWKELFTIKANRKSLFLTVSLMCFQQMSGSVVIGFYATTIFELAGSSLEPNIASIMIAIVQVCSSLITPICVDRLGRRALLIISTATTSAILAILGSYFYLDFVSDPSVNNIRLLPVICLASFYISYCTGLSIIPGVLVGEMFTPRVRSLGASIGYVVALTLGFFLITAFGYIITMTGGHVPFWFFSATCACACLVSVFFVPETKGKSLQEIQDMLNN